METDGPTVTCSRSGDLILAMRHFVTGRLVLAYVYVTVTVIVILIVSDVCTRTTQTTGRSVTLRYYIFVIFPTPYDTQHLPGEVHNRP